MKKQSARNIRIAGFLLFSLYLIFLIYFMFFAESYGRTIIRGEYQYNLIPFKEIRRFIDHSDKLGMLPVLLNLAGNIVGFMPFGFMIPILSRNKRNIWTVMLLSLQFSLLIETAQLLLRVGCFDVDDLMLNTLGGMAGYILFWICNTIRRKLDGSIH